MARRTQGSGIWFVGKKPTGKNKIILVGCPLNFKPGTDSRDKHETTCLYEEETKKYLEGGGLSDPGTTTFDINADPSDPTHVRLYNMVGGESVQWIKGWAGKKKGSMKTVIPTVDEETGEVTLPPQRSWTTFNGYVDSFPLDTDSNTLEKSTVTVQRDTKVTWIPETSPAP